MMLGNIELLLWATTKTNKLRQAATYVVRDYVRDFYSQKKHEM